MVIFSQVSVSHSVHVSLVLLFVNKALVDAMSLVTSFISSLRRQFVHCAIFCIFKLLGIFKMKRYSRKNVDFEDVVENAPFNVASSIIIGGEVFLSV